MAAASGRGSRGKSGGRPRTGASGRSARATGSAHRPRAKARTTAPTVAPEPAPFPPGPLRLGAVPGATPGKWIDAWHDRMDGIPLELSTLALADQRTALLGEPGAASVDAALVRLPLDPSGLHLITLYEEVAVVVCAADSHLTAADELTTADLAGEVVIVPRDAPPTPGVPGTLAPRFAPVDVPEAIATVAAGVGVVVVPMSLARLHHRKDTAYRPLRDAPVFPVALAWPAADETSRLVEAFIGIVRGRTANSSR